MVAEVAVVWGKVYAVEVKMEGVWVDGVFMRTLVSSVEDHSIEKPVFLPHCHLEEVQSASYI